MGCARIRAAEAMGPQGPVGATGATDVTGPQGPVGATEPYIYIKVLQTRMVTGFSANQNITEISIITHILMAGGFGQAEIQKSQSKNLTEFNTYFIVTRELKILY